MLETKLKSRNLFKGIKTWAVSVMRYSAALLGWSILQLEEIYRRTRMLLAMHNGFHSKSNVDLSYLSRSDGGRGLIGVQDTVEKAILELRNYVKNSKERLLIAARTIGEDEDREAPKECKKRKKNERKTQRSQKQLHGQFFRKTMGKASEDRWRWVRKGCLKRTTEVLTMATQKQANRTNNKVFAIRTRVAENCPPAHCSNLVKGS